MRSGLREGCRDVLMNLPKTGEHIVLEKGDASNVTERTVIRVNRAEVKPHDFGMVTVYGWKIGSDGFPSTLESAYRVSSATLDARRAHRRG